MPKPLTVVAAEDPANVLVALRAALAGDGPAILPRVSSSVVRSAIEDAADALPQLVPRRVALVVQTSGSTGRPKRVALSADALLASAAASDAALGGPGQWLLALPAHYIAGINVLVRSIAAGTDPVILPSGHFDPDSFVTAASTMDGPLRYVSLVPAQLARLIQTDSALETLRRFNRILVGGQSMPSALQAQARELGLTVTRTYGSSETSGGCVYDGEPIGATTMHIIDGQIELGGPVLAEGYLGEEARTTEAFYTESGWRWYRTGDTGKIVDGVLQVTGRLDDVIISGGVNVSLGSVERLVRTLQGLEDAVVIARPDERWGHVPVVVSTTSADLADLRAAISAQLGPAAAPAAIELVTSIPMLPSGKPDRIALGR